MFLINIRIAERSREILKSRKLATNEQKNAESEQKLKNAVKIFKYF